MFLASSTQTANEIKVFGTLSFSKLPDIESFPPMAASDKSF